MDILAHIQREIRLYREGIGLSIGEAIWPTRCAVCDAPGVNLCEACKKKLPYIDYWQRCPRCGAPYGRIFCTECSSFELHSKGLERLPYSECISCVSLSDESSRIVRTWKDAGDQALAGDMARIMNSAIPTSWHAHDACLVPIPASKDAYQKRGFDHIELLTCELSKRSSLPIRHVFERPSTTDQRKLGKEERVLNAQDSFMLKKGVWVPQTVILVDDVQTTGSTLTAASLALKHARTKTIRCLTFARA